MLRSLQSFRYVKKNTIIHNLDPRSKMLFVILLSFLIFISNNIITLCLILFLVMITAYIAKSVSQLLRMLKGILPWIIFIFVVNYFTSEKGILIATTISLKFAALAIVFTLFFITTSPEDFMLALNKLGLPYEYTLAFTMAMRFVPSLARDLQIIIDAQKSRGLELEKGNFIERIKRYIPILVPLIVYEIRRSFMIAEALESRAFGSTERTFYYELRITKNDILFTVFSCIVVMLLYLIEVFFKLF